ncbi:hypothetical protein BU24DRAFT_279528 [Aaosphaeria arxii CBS 175.79]|uniref:GPI anchored protein n=1 Tax=Aaosphaeria arxii CBS 175.79 TaxID=1450172 RepID=A0A6A5XE78_9PLEO|nr:uncharacterized protein BU24DRAFT_279528 [Aaosphaeria arxii CBS 175.79]KAF2011352.1 hypothetical protein BU24DRAFT_279528 [Aaosphaeria arxii CBS 175.79]
MFNPTTLIAALSLAALATALPHDHYEAHTTSSTLPSHHKNPQPNKSMKEIQLTPSPAFVYTGPMFNPTEALNYGPVNSSYYQNLTTSTSSSVRSSTTSSHFTIPASETRGSVRSTATETPSETTRESATPTETVLEVTGTGAASGARYSGYVGAVAGVVAAGFAMI